jgi:quinoprotein glucose dehydrogenase
MYRSHIGHALVCFSISILAWMSFPSCNSAGEKDTEWTAVGGSKANMHYSVLTEIDTSNVSLLAPAWTYDTGDADTVNHSQIQCNPLIIDGTLYGVTPQLKLFAVDAATGTNKWTFDPYDTAFKKNSMFFAMNNCRGIAYWTDGKGKRIFYSAGSALISVNAETGRPDSAFANQGRLDLHDGLDRDVSTLYVAASSAGMVWKDLIIIGSRVDEGADAAPGHIRAFDVRTGKRAWIFHTIPQPGEPGHESWDDPNAWQRIGGANNWSGMSLDEQRGILFVPTGSASFDFYGGKRLGNALYANCLLALDVATGKKRWHFQGIHHDMWDRDFPAPPALVTVMHEGKKVDAVAQTSKTGFIFLLDRETGKSLFPIEERPVPTDTKLIGEKASPTQPIPLKPAPLVRQHFAESELNDLVPDTSYQKIHNTWTGLRKDHLFAPPSPEGTVILPGFDGGAEWGGPAFDPQTGLLYVNTSEMAWILKMVKQPLVPEKENYPQAGQRLYFQYCMACHGYDRKGTGNYPAIDTADRKYNDSSFLGLINSGRRMMPAFKQIKDEEKKAILTFILGKKGLEKTMFPPQPVDSFRSLPYTNTGYIKFLTPEGYPAIKPPWGNLTAVNLNTGEKAWSVTLGEYPEFAAKGIQTGTENYGGPVVTAGGVLFIAATRDGKIRAYNKRTGKLLWSFDLPAPGFATPSVYSVKGRQYLVIACGGGKLGTKSGGKYMAFALPMTK